MVAIRVYEWKPAGPNAFGKSFGLKQAVRAVSVPMNAASAIRTQLEECVQKGCLGSEALAELNSGIRADRFQHLLGELRRSGLRKGFKGSGPSHENRQSTAEETDYGRDEEPGEWNEEDEQDETIVSGAKRRGKKTPKRQEPEAEDDEYTPDYHRGAYAQSWNEYVRAYAGARRRGDEFSKSSRDLREATAELEAIVQLYEG
jgi:hypothetical protein